MHYLDQKNELEIICNNKKPSLPHLCLFVNKNEIIWTKEHIMTRKKLEQNSI